MITKLIAFLDNNDGQSEKENNSFNIDCKGLTYLVINLTMGVKG